MNKFVRCFLLVLALLAVVPGFAATYVAVVETVAENGAIGHSERLFLTDKLRERAKMVLPAYMVFFIMTRENIQQMLPPGKKIEDCEGECLVKTGKNINAHYIAQARVGKFGSQLTLTVEMYETMGNNLVGSFTARKPSADGLLDEIERQADGLFAMIAGGNGGGQAAGGADGFEGINMGGSGYKASGTKRYIVNVNSNPSGAVFSVDGRPDAECSKTPCDITLSAGSHRFSFGLKMYFDKDTVFEAKQSGQKLAVKLNPNFGELTLKPRLQSGVGSADGLNFEIDGNKVTGEKFRLAPGRHSVAISHGCYETASFNVNINNGSDLVFDKPLVAKTGGLDLRVLENGRPKALPVFVNGNRMGVTPFLETVPVCSKVTLGDDREQVPVKLKANETVTYKHEFGGGSTFTDSRDGLRYKTVKIGNQVWMAQNLNYDPGNVSSMGSYAWSGCYNNESSNCAKYGRLYTWEVAMSNSKCAYGKTCNASLKPSTPVRGVCPSGWHLPSHREFEELINFIDPSFGYNHTSDASSSTAGKYLKSKSGWNSNGNGTDAYGFSALPGGNRYDDGDFSDVGLNALFWSSGEYNSSSAFYLYLDYYYEGAYLYYRGKNYARSVRCVRDSN